MGSVIGARTTYIVLLAPPAGDVGFAPMSVAAVQLRVPGCLPEKPAVPTPQSSVGLPEGAAAPPYGLVERAAALETLRQTRG